MAGEKQVKEVEGDQRERGGQSHQLGADIICLADVNSHTSHHLF